jgi:hypothetical protein
MLQVAFEEEPETEETERILANAELSAKLSKSNEEAKQGKLTKILPGDLWK